jgi:hypothetical protein
MNAQFARDSVQAQSGSLSRRATLLGSGAAFLTAALATRGIAAQHATPGPDELTVEALGAGMPAGTPGRQLILARATFPAGFTLHAHSHPGPVVVFVESGTYGYTPLSEGARSVTRAAAPEAPETPDLGAEVLLEAGDSLFHDEPVIGIDRAVGDEPAVLLLAVLFDPTQPLYHLADEGTPTP